MKNNKKYIIKIDSKTGEILTEDFDNVIDALYRNQSYTNFELIIIDQHNIIDDRINTIINHYLKECLRTDGNRCFAITFSKESYQQRPLHMYIRVFLRGIVENLASSYHDTSYESLYVLDCFNPKDKHLNEHYFSFSLPIMNFKGSHFLARGGDYLMGSLSPVETEKYVLPAYYLFLYEYDGFEDETLNDLREYKIGLK